MNTDDKLRDYLKKVTLELRKTQSRLQEVEANASAPIAIVGLACRCPARVDSPEGYWAMLVEGGDGIGDFPIERGWDVDAFYDPDPNAPRKSYVRQGGFLREAARFDAEFFGLSPREALVTDPQQRLLLETTWEALERTGLPPGSLLGSQTGVFIGLAQNDYGKLGTPAEVEGYLVTGSAASVASGRISYTLGLQGPAITVDTACSASLVALHVACQSLRLGECDLALAGGAAVLPTPEAFVEFSRQRALSPEGRCKPFSANADGTAWGEAAGMLVLERLSDAERNGRPILALIRGSAVNQDGKSQGLTAPNGLAQQAVIRQALASAQLTAADIDALEAHGTGTKLGDPIEAEALAATYGKGHSPEQPFWLGSVKSNLGHTQAAAGVMGVIKLVLALQHELLPKSLHCDPPTPHVDWSSGTVQLLREARAWARGNRPRRAAVSSFGISGTNAHLIVEEAPLRLVAPGSEPLPPATALAAAPPKPLPFVLSARSELALRDQARRLHAHLEQHPELGFSDVAHSLATTRACFEQRAVVVAADGGELSSALLALAAGEASAAVALGQARASGKLVFVFPGQGGQWLGMARALLASSEPFAREIEACERALAPFVDWSLHDVLRADEGELLQRVDVVQPVLFAVMVSLAAVWRAHGVEPDAVVGHSQGEIAAAYVAGALSLSDAARIVALRSSGMYQLTGLGGMAAVELSAAELEARLERFEGRLLIAAENSPNASVVTGERAALDALLEELAAAKILARRVDVSVPAHSALTERIETQLRRDLAVVSPRTATIPIYSTVRAEWIDGRALDAEYWYRNVRDRVRFAATLQALLLSGHRHFVEVSPHPVLTQAVRAGAEAAKVPVAALATLRREQGDLRRFALALGELHTAGGSVDLPRVIGGGRRVPLPTYAFQREHFWLERDPGQAGDLAALGLAPAEHPLLGASVALASGDGMLFTGRLSLSTHRWLAGHVLYGAALLPATAFVELALSAAQRLGLDAIEELTLEAPLVLPERGGVSIQLALSAPQAAGARTLAIYARSEEAPNDAAWTCHATATLVSRTAAARSDAEVFASWPPAGAELVDLDGFYDRLDAAGVAYGETFRGLVAAYRRGEELFAELKLPDDAAKDAPRYALHPALLDAALQTLALREGSEPAMPFAWQGVRLEASGARSMRVRLSCRHTHEVAIWLGDDAGELIGTVDALYLRPVSQAQVRRAAERREALYRVSWSALPEADVVAPRWALLGTHDSGAGLPEPAERYADLAALSAALSAGVQVPSIVVAPCLAAESGDVLATAHAAAHRTLALLQAWLADVRLHDSRLIVVTRGAVAALDGDALPDLGHAPLWGLVRAVQAECGDVMDVRLIDLDLELVSSQRWVAALANAEPQLALRSGVLYAPRITAAPLPNAAVEPAALPSDGTVLITGGTGAIAAHVAEHLVTRSGVRRLVLCSRSGSAPELEARLTGLGASVTIARCDVSRRDDLESLLAAIPQAHPLRAVFHVAVALADGALAAQTADGFDHVFAAKLDGAFHLHELTRGLPLHAFVMFSSLAGVMGNAGVSNYAAANSFLDALAQRRRAEGLPATSIAWGLWDLQHGLARAFSPADLQRMQRSGMLGLTVEQGIALLDAALASRAALSVAARFDTQRFARSEAAQLPWMLRGFGRPVRKRAQTRAGVSSLRTRLSRLGPAERERALFDVVKAALSAVMGMSAASVDPDRPLSELGLDSLMAIQLRNHLATAGDLRLPSTLLFDYPTPRGLCQYLDGRLSDGESRNAVEPIDRQVATAQPIAIVAVSCRFAGGIDTPEALWQLLASGADTVTEFPTDRGWSGDDLYDPDPEASGKSSVRRGAFLRDVAAFDPVFFGISPREASAIDPQQRLLLETAWEVLERAGIDPHALRGSATGVFIGLSQTDYALLGLPPELEGYATGAAFSVASGRIAYQLGLQGPALTVDTACSSSLVALHLACQSLRQGECDLALAGGATVMATPSLLVAFSRQRGLAPDGRCKAFSDTADGTGLGEGVAMLALERLSDAQRHGRVVQALVRGSAVNQDGKSQGLTAPNGPAQEAVIRRALANAQLTAADVDAVEAHGTGTRLGDPIEAQALLATYGAERPQESPLWLGALKSNLGHTQAAGGAAGVIKLVLALEHGVLPKTLHAGAPTRHVDWSAGPVRLLQEPVVWARSQRPRRAAVSSFGLSGTNAHVILEEAPQSASRDAVSERVTGCLPFVLSARSHAALRAQAERLEAQLIAQPEWSALDVAHSLATTRSTFEVRRVLVADERSGLLDALAALAKEQSPAAVTQPPRGASPLAFLFTGQGSQRLQMGRALYQSSAPFRAALDAVFTGFEGLLEPRLQDVLFAAEGTPEANLLDATAYSQPALFALEVALYRCLEHWGVTADYLLGHSIGEIAAAHVADVMSLADACKLVAARARLMHALPAGGAMAAVEASQAEVERALVAHGDRVSIAALNGPRSVVVSGDERAVEAVMQVFAGSGRRVRRLQVSHAFHSSHMLPMLDAFAQVVSTLTLQPARLPIVSSVSGALIEPSDMCAPSYWVQQVRQTVRFHAGLETLRAAGVDTFLELGPREVLSTLVRDVYEADADRELAAWSMLRDSQDEMRNCLSALAGLYGSGRRVEWKALLADHEGRAVALPTYAFQRQRYWLDAGLLGRAEVVAELGLDAAEHALLGANLELAEGGGVVFTGRLSRAQHGWLTGHEIAGSVILPGTAFVELALAAARRVDAGGIEELILESPLVIPERGGVQLQLAVGAKDESGLRSLSLHARSEEANDEAWTRYAHGTLSAETGTPAYVADGGAWVEWPPAGSIALALEDFYAGLTQLGVAFGPAFRGLRAAYRCGDDLLAEVALADDLSHDATRYGLHPALFDAALHALFLHEDSAELALPFAWQGVRLFRTGLSSLRVKLSRKAPGQLSLLLADGDGQWVGAVDTVHVRPVSGLRDLARSSVSRDLYRVDWKSLPESAAAPQTWTILGADPLDLPLGSTTHADLAALAVALDAGVAAPDFVVLPCAASPGFDSLGDARQATRRVLEVLQAWVADERFASSRLLVVTRGAVAADPHDRVPDLQHAPVWGLVRAAQSEHPDAGLKLADLDDVPSPETWASLLAALSSGETQLAVRGATLRAPRLASHASVREPAASPAVDPVFTHGTVLITGGSGALAGVVAEHLVVRHGARDLLLCSRSGRAEPLASRLSELGARVRVAQCDVAERAQVEALLASIPAEHPLCAVIHTAGLIDDGVLAAQTGERIAHVFAPKLDGAWHLHELTQQCELQAFVLFSSVAGVLGSPGQSNYSAANSFLDALAQRRRAEGRVATSLAWGQWAAPSGLTTQLGQADRARLERGGLEALASDEALQLFDAALRSDAAMWVPSRFAPRMLAAQGARVPSMLRGLSRARAARPKHGADAAGSLKQRVASLDAAQRERVLLDAVLSVVSHVLGAPVASIGVNRPIVELGLDSLMAVELRNQLGAVAGLRLPATLLFDHPTPHALRGYLESRLTGATHAARPAISKLREATAEPIAIVGMSCRYPGGVDSPESLWSLLLEARDATSDFPSDRGWSAEDLYDPDPAALGKSVVTRGGFLHDAAEFDPAFFGMSAREALATDPQQRLLLETTWEALERASVAPGSLRGSATGVFVGIMYNDYAGRFAVGSAGAMEGFLAVGSAASVASGRISYCLGLHGPAITVDTACSSSLVALHLASQSLRQGECDLAIAGGATVMATPAAFVEFSRQRGLAADGRCKSFSASADGVAWSEGVGVLVLQRVSDARRDGRNVLALVRGSAVNQDGKSQGLTAPNGPAQEEVIRQALAHAQLAPSDVDAVEGHGTGTSLGDPIEAQALLATYGASRRGDQPLLLGSLKSNLGHAQAAAGVGGVIKVVLALQHELLPKTLHAEEPSPHVDWSVGAVRLLQAAVPWKPNGRPRRAAVSSFGIGGTNAHLIVEEAPRPADPRLERESNAAPELLPFLVSAQRESALRSQAARLCAYLRAHPELALPELAHSLASTRDAFEVRAVVLAADRRALCRALEQLSEAEASPVAITGQARSATDLAMLFSGQGSQRPGMGLGLYEQFPVFRAALDASFDAFAGKLELPLREVMFAEPGSAQAGCLDRTGYTQPALFAFEVALYRQLEAWGVRPKYLLGHSIGEIAACHVAGVMSLADASTLVAARAQLMEALPEGGAMLALEASEDEVAPWLEKTRGVSLAAVNGALAVVLSGDEPQLRQLREHFEAEGRRARWLPVSHAFHSARMDPLLEPFARAIERIELSPARLPIVSSVTGELAAPELFTDRSYWVKQLRQTVRFAPAVRALSALGASAYLELGPQAALSVHVEELVSSTDAAEASVWPAQSRDLEEREALLRALAGLHVRCDAVDWKAFFAPLCARCVPLPTYAFQHERYWLASSSAAGDSAVSVGLARVGHPLLGAALAEAEGERLRFTGRLSRSLQPWLAEHSVFEQLVAPASLMLELALSAGQSLGLAAVQSLTLDRPLVVPERNAVQLQVTVGAQGAERRRPVAVYARREGAGLEAKWERHAHGTLAPNASESASDLRVWPPPGASALSIEGFYEGLAEAGMSCGETFRGLCAAYRRGSEVFAEVRLPEAAQQDANRYALHPALLEAAQHALALSEPSAALALPVAWRGVALRSSGACELRVCVTARPNATGSFSLSLADGAGEPLGDIAFVQAKPPAPRVVAQPTAAGLEGMYSVDWTKEAAPAEVAPSWTVLEDLAAAPLEICDRPHVDRTDLTALFAALDAGAQAPERLVLPCFADPSDVRGVPRAAGVTTQRVLEILKAWLADERLAASQLTVLTRRAIAAAELESVFELSHAPLWGLVRSAQSEYPDRALQLIDLDDAASSIDALPAALASKEPQLAIRAGELRSPRLAALVRANVERTACDLTRGTVLITGGSGVLAGLLARHLVARHGVRNLVMCSRSGQRADALLAELAEQGASATLAACDVSDREALARLLAAIPAEHSLSAVFHTAGVLDDAVLTAQDGARLEKVFAPKLTGAWHLHELTRDRELAAFVMFSSVSGVVGASGQANYAAANSFLDALCQRRRADGLAATALSWGYWSERSAMTGNLDARQLARIARAGIDALEVEQGLALLDAALTVQPAHAVTARFNREALRDADHVPRILQGLVRSRVRRVSASAALKARLAVLSQTERETHVLHVVQSAIAKTTNVMLSDVRVDRPVQEHGLDSLMALELRKYLAAQTGLRLPASLLFDYPTPAKLARRLHSEMAAGLPNAVTPLLEELDRLEALLTRVELKEPAHVRTLDVRLKAFAHKWLGTADRPEPQQAIEQELYGADDEELYRLVDKSLT